MNVTKDEKGMIKKIGGDFLKKFIFTCQMNTITTGSTPKSNSFSTNKIIERY